MNDVLKKFVVVFGANTKPLEAGVKNSTNLINAFGKVLMRVGAVIGTGLMFKNAVSGFAGFNNQISQAISLSNYNVESLSAMGGALKRFGGDTNSAISSLDSLNNALHNAKFGSGALIEVSQRYGINFTNSNGSLMNAEQLLESLSVQMSKFDNQTKKSIGASLGLDSSVINALASGNTEFKKLIDSQKKFGVITQRDLKISERFSHAILDLKDSFAGITRAFSRFVIPLLTKLLKLVTSFIEFLKKHKVLVMAFFAGMLLAMTPILAMFIKIAIASAAAFAPFYAIGAVIAAVALVIEDIYYYFKGWDSVTCDLAKKFPALAIALEPLRAVFEVIESLIKGIVGWISDPTWNNFVNIFKDLGNVIMKHLAKPLEFIKNTFNHLIDKITSFFSGKFGKLFGFEAKTEPSVVSPSNNTSTTNNQVTNNVTQNISSATPKQLADDFNSLAIDSINTQRQISGGR